MDELGYFITDGNTSVHDLQATILTLLGLGPWKFRFPLSGPGTALDRAGGRGRGDPSGFGLNVNDMARGFGSRGSTSGLFAGQSVSIDAQSGACRISRPQAKSCTSID
jgi:hypothetical protein